jgi:hypothetical protein
MRPAAPLLDITYLEPAEFLAPQSIIEKHGEDGVIALALERLGIRRA